MGKYLSRLSMDVGSVWLGYTPAYLCLVPFWFLAAIANAAASSERFSLWFVIVANLVGFVATFAEFAALKRLVWNRFSATTVPLWIAIMSGGFLGGTKGLVTTTLLASVGSTAQQDMILKISTACILGMVASIAVPVTCAEFQRLKADRDFLIAAQTQELLFGESASPPTNHPDLERFVSTALSKLEPTRLLPGTVLEVLGSIQNDDLRPLVERLGRPRRREVSRLLFTELMSMCVTRLDYSAFWVATIVCAVAAPVQLGSTNATNGVLTASAEFIATYFILRTAQRRRHVTLALGITSFLGSSVLIAGTCTLGLSALNSLNSATETSLVSTIVTISSTFMVALSAQFMSAFINLSVRERASIRKQLIDLNPLLESQAFSYASSAASSRNLSELLHSRVQNAFLIKTFLLHNRFDGQEQLGPGDVAYISTTVESLRQLLLGLLQPTLQPANHHDVLSALLHQQALWAGVLAVVFAESEATICCGSLSERDVKRIIKVVEEVVTNSAKHGLATEVHLSFELATELRPAGETSLRISARDNGLGIRGGPAGLGSTIFDSVAQANWSLSSPGDGGTHFQMLVRLDTS